MIVPIAIHVLERQRDGREILSIAEQYRPEIDHGMRAVPTRALDDLHMPVQIDGKEMARTGGRVVVSNDSIRLERARPAVVPVILGDLPPVEEHTSPNPQRKHRQHPNPKYEYPMRTPARSWFLAIRFLGWMVRSW